LNDTEFVAALVEAGIEEPVARFVWEKFEPYYFEPLTPYPSDRPVSDFKIDGDDLSDFVMDFEHEFGRRWLGRWAGAEDPTLLEFAAGLTSSTEPR